jgi:hypothetical protein
MAKIFVQMMVASADVGPCVVLDHDCRADTGIPSNNSVSFVRQFELFVAAHVTVFSSAAYGT